MSQHTSNESSDSSRRSSISSDDASIPALVTAEEGHLPTFAEAATTLLPRTNVPSAEEPPSFRLTVATCKLEQEFPPVSPRTAEVLLRTDPDINDTIQAIAYGLIATIHHRTLHASQELDESHTCEQQACQQLAAQWLEITHLQGRLRVIDIPAGFEPNLGHVIDTVPLSTGERVVPQFIHRMGTREVEMVARCEGNEPIYIAQLVLTPDCSLPPAEPIQIWFSDLLTSTGDKFDTLAKAAYELDDWAAHTKIMRYHRIDTEHRLIEEELATLCGQLSLNNEALDGCRFRIKVSRVPYQLRNLQGRSDFPQQCGEQLGWCIGGRARQVTGSGVPV